MTWDYVFSWGFRVLFTFAFLRIMWSLNAVVSRTQRLDSLRIEGLESAIDRLETIDKRQDEIARLVEAKTAKAAEAVAEGLQTINAKIDQNTQLTIDAAAASANAADLANHANEKIASSHGEMIVTFKELYRKPEEK